MPVPATNPLSSGRISVTGTPDGFLTPDEAQPTSRRPARLINRCEKRWEKFCFIDLKRIIFRSKRTQGDYFLSAITAPQTPARGETRPWRNSCSGVAPSTEIAAGSRFFMASACRIGRSNFKTIQSWNSGSQAFTWNGDHADRLLRSAGAVVFACAPIH